MVYTERTKKTLNFVYEFYRENRLKTKDGLNAIFHAYEVASTMDTESSTIVALLHDYLEDGGDGKYMQEELDITQEEYEAILLLTRQRNIPYTKYIHEISKNEIAKKVKIQDLFHNSDRTRLSYISACDIERNEKYKNALDYLLFGGRMEWKDFAQIQPE